MLKWNGTSWACASDAAGPANAFVHGGNAFGTVALLGTNDAHPLELEAGNARVMRYEPNTISPNVIGGNPANSVTAGVRGATIAGGGVPPGDTDPNFGGEAPNRVTDAYGTVGGGFANRAGNDAGSTTDASFATVAGGVGNDASGVASNVGGGSDNIASGPASAVAGGDRNIASGVYSTVAGGVSSSASGNSSSVAGGNNNTASGNQSTVAGGTFNTASGPYSTVAGGSDNAASGNFSTVAGGYNNTAGGDYSFAAGRNATATLGSFAWADSRLPDFSFPDTNFFGVRATGGVIFTIAINATGGGLEFCRLQPGVLGWICVSDREGKENLKPAQGEEILAKLAGMPVYSWNFKGADPDLRNLGPTAQDFHAAFGFGNDPTTIAGSNLLGVALAAIQGLNAKLEASVAELARELAALRERQAIETTAREDAAQRIAALQRAVDLLLVRQESDTPEVARSSP